MILITKLVKYKYCLVQWFFPKPAQGHKQDIRVQISYQTRMEQVPAYRILTGRQNQHSQSLKGRPVQPS